MVSGNRAAVVDVLALVAFVLIGVWGVVNLSERDWFIGGGMLVCAVLGAGSRGARMLQERRRRPRGPWPPTNSAVG